MNEMSYEKLIQTLKASGARLTPQRKAICRVLAASNEHPSAQMIFDQLNSLEDNFSLATVYNTLETLSRLGAINVLGEIGDQDSVRYDANNEPHVNLACVRCHNIIDIESQHISGLVQEISETSGYSILGARVLYYGLCPDCQAQPTVSKPISSNQ